MTMRTVEVGGPVGFVVESVVNAELGIGLGVLENVLGVLGIELNAVLAKVLELLGIVLRVLGIVLGVRNRAEATPGRWSWPEGQRTTPTRSTPA